MSVARARLLRGAASALLVVFFGLHAGVPVGEAAPKPAIDHLVLVVLGGGVHASDLTDKARMPNLAALAEEGAVVADVLTSARNTGEAAAVLLTGSTAAWVEGAHRATEPTLMERARAAANWPREATWFVSFEGGDALKLGTSSHARFGPSVGPGLAAEEGAFGKPLAPFLEGTGRPNPITEKGWDLLRSLRVAGRRAIASRLPGDLTTSGTARAERIERALLTEIDARSLLVRGPSPRDTRAWRAAHTLWDVHHPRLLVIRLGEAAQGDVSADAYRAVLRENDRELGRLHTKVLRDKARGPRTLFVVASDLGRRADPDEAGTLRGGAPKVRANTRVVFTGAGLPKRVKRVRDARMVDLTPTLLHLLGLGDAAPTPGEASGAPWGPILGGR